MIYWYSTEKNTISNKQDRSSIIFATENEAKEYQKEYLEKKQKEKEEDNKEK